MAHNVIYGGELTQPTAPVKFAIYVGTAALTPGNFVIVKKNADLSGAFGAVDAGTTVTAELTDGYYELAIDENDLQVLGMNVFKCEDVGGDIGTIIITVKADPTDEAAKFASAPNDI